MKDLRTLIFTDKDCQEVRVKETERDTDKEIKTGDEVLITIQGCIGEGVKGKVLLAEEGMCGSRIIFKTPYHKENEFDLLYLNSYQHCWKTECGDYSRNTRKLLGMVEDDFEFNNLNETLKFLKQKGVKYVPCDEIPQLQDWNIW